jgi:hypothetical protein
MKQENNRFMDTLLDTLCEGRLSFLEISTFPEMLIYSTPTISSNEAVILQGIAVFSLEFQRVATIVHNAGYRAYLWWLSKKVCGDA